MASELPHALLECSECGTSFKLTLKKGRPPSKPVPCPKCKHAITVTAEHIAEPGAKPAGKKVGKALRQTKPGDVLRQTKLVQIDETSIASMMDPPTSEVPLDPPTAEVLVDPDNVPLDATPAFGIVSRKKINPSKKKKPASEKTKPAGVSVVKGTGSGRRDNVFGGRTSGSIAIGRIGGSAPSGRKVASSDPDLPRAADAEPEAASQSKPKLNLAKLRSVMAKLDVEDDETGHSGEISLEDFAPDIPSLDEEPEVEPQEELVLFEPSDASAAEESEASEPEEVEASEPEEVEAGEPDEVEAGDEELSEAEADEDSEAEPDFGHVGEHSEAEPEIVTLDVEDSEAYQLGDAANVPVRAEEPKRGNAAGIVAGVIVLAAIAAFALFVLT